MPRDVAVIKTKIPKRLENTRFTINRIINVIAERIL